MSKAIVYMLVSSGHYRGESLDHLTLDELLSYRDGRGPAVGYAAQNGYWQAIGHYLKGVVFTGTCTESSTAIYDQGV